MRTVLFASFSSVYWGYILIIVFLDFLFFFLLPIYPTGTKRHGVLSSEDITQPQHQSSRREEMGRLRAYLDFIL